MSKGFKKLLIIAAFVSAPFAASLFGFGSSNASAVVLDYNSAVAEINTRCAQGYTLAHATYGSSPSLNMNTGVVTYNFNVLWMRCNGNYTGEYAVTGYNGDACPVIGYYHNQWVGTQDCVKYTDRHGEGRSFGLCGSPRCVLPGFNANVRKGGYNGPPVGVLYSRTIGSRTQTIPNWGAVGAVSGSTNLFLANVCGAHFQSPGQWRDIYCMPSYISVSWVRINYELTPTITSVPDNSGLETPQSRTVTGTVNNRGPTPSRTNIDWRLTQVIYAPNAAIPQRGGGASASGTLPCTFFTGETACSDTGVGVRGAGYAVGNTQESALANIGEYDVGTRICFALSVRQYTHLTEDWRHSPLRCYIAGKKPKVNVLGGDLMVGRTVVGANAPAAARVLTSETQNSFGIFGSWSEYGIVPTGSVAGMRSGSGSVRGNTVNTNLLTFANTGNNVATCGSSLGCYGQAGTLPDVGSRFRTSSSSPQMTSTSLTGSATGVYRGSGNITISGSTIAAGKWIVINAPTANITIAGDINYAQGPFTSASQIPQVIIIANNITINDNVGNVDAWLVAPGTNNGGAVTGGVIRTCNVAPAAISVSACSNKLTVNGPVIANRLLMLRTNGAERGEASGDPAEVFNFRPDAYLWALQQGISSGRVTTVSTKELPPRY